MKHIVAFDATTESKLALRHAFDEAAGSSDLVIALHAVEQTVSDALTDGGPPVLEGLDAAEQRSDRVLSVAKAIASKYQTPFDTDVVYGIPAESIIDYSDTEESATIYIGHREIASEKTSIGSVAKKVQKDCSHPVTIVN